MELKGLWFHEVFLEVLGSHLTQIAGAAKVKAFGDLKTIHPVGAVGLCAASVRFKITVTSFFTHLNCC